MQPPLQKHCLPPTPAPAVEPETHLGLVKVTLPGGKEIYVPEESIQMPPTQPETGHKRTAPSLGSQTSDIKEEAVEYGDMDPAARAALTQKVKLFDIKRSRRLDPSEGLIQDVEIAGPSRPSFEVTPPSQEGETLTELKAAIQQYHETQLAPALRSIQDYIQQISPTGKYWKRFHTPYASSLFPTKPPPSWQITRWLRSPLV